MPSGIERTLSFGHAEGVLPMKTQRHSPLGDLVFFGGASRKRESPMTAGFGGSKLEILKPAFGHCHVVYRSFQYEVPTCLKLSTAGQND